MHCKFLLVKIEVILCLVDSKVFERKLTNMVIVGLGKFKFEYSECSSNLMSQSLDILDQKTYLH